jgi:hypothetical protein
MTPSKNQSHEGESWEKEFDVKFNHFNQQHSSKQICDSECENDYGLEDIKDFIRSLQKFLEYVISTSVILLRLLSVMIVM